MFLFATCDVNLFPPGHQAATLSICVQSEESRRKRFRTLRVQSEWPNLGALLRAASGRTAEDCALLG
jgi:hypothetical protein